MCAFLRQRLDDFGVCTQEFSIVATKLLRDDFESADLIGLESELVTYLEVTRCRVFSGK